MRLRDTLTGELRELEPAADGTIGFYVCGPTVYGRIHVGNARPVVVFLQMKRYLEWRGQPVRLVENITDINDKIYVAARARGVRSDDLAAEMARAFIDDTDRLGLGRPDEEPLATETIPEIVALIEELVASGHAYEAGGDVYFAVRSFDRYGELSGQRADEVEAGARVEPGEHKRDPVDFALWKATKDDEDTWWPSPWGDGRPAWHIECSAMAEKLLGQGVRRPRRRARPDLPAPRERDRPVLLDRPRVRAGVGAQRHAAAGGREDVEVRGEHRSALRRARPLGARDADHVHAPGPLREPGGLHR